MQYAHIFQSVNHFLPLITVDKLHVHTVSAHERLAVERCVNIWGMWNRRAQHSDAGEGWLWKPTQDLRGTAAAHLEVPRAMQHLTDRPATPYFTKHMHICAAWRCMICLCVLTFQLADLRLTLRPLLVTVHFILIKKSLPMLISFPLLPYTGPVNQTTCA